MFNCIVAVFHVTVVPLVGVDQVKVNIAGVAMTIKFHPVLRAQVLPAPS